MAFLEINALAQALRRARNPQGHRPDARQGRLSRAGRPVRLRQVDPAQHHRRPRVDQLGRDPHRRPGDQRSAPVQARHRHGVPVLRALSQHVGRAEHGLRHGDARRAEARARQGGRRRRQDAADRTSAEPPAEPALRRPAPARRDGPRAGAPAARLPVRRAAVQSRRQAARRHARSRSSGSISRPERRSSMSPTTRSRR